jgi:hypothetical protein
MNTSLDPDRGRPPLDSHALRAPEALTLRIEVRPDPDRMLVCPAGEVDLATADTLESRTLEIGSDQMGNGVTPGIAHRQR